MKIINLDETDSTNEYCKRVGRGDLIVTAVRQSAGKGTKGRSFCSGEGGLYVSVMRHNTGYEADEAFKIMINACVAVCRTVESFKVKPVIRWANDVLVNGRKICGTLIENTFSGNTISRSIIGIGLNVNNVLTAELKDIATTLSSELGNPVDLDRVRTVLLKNLAKEYTVADYKKYIDWLGSEVILKTSSGEKRATAVDVDWDGGLLCIIGGSLKKINSAEVSLRL